MRRSERLAHNRNSALADAIERVAYVLRMAPARGADLLREDERARVEQAIECLTRALKLDDALDDPFVDNPEDRP